MTDGATLVTLAVHFAILSLFAVGGANAAVPEMHRLAVEVMGWMTDRQFADMFALAQVAPGPNMIVVTLIGYHVAGFAGAAGHHDGDVRPELRVRIFHGPGLGALQGCAVADCHPGRPRADLRRPGRRERGHFDPSGGPELAAVVITAATASVAYLTRWNPLWMFAAAALLGVAGLV